MTENQLHWNTENLDKLKKLRFCDTFTEMHKKTLRHFFSKKSQWRPTLMHILHMGTKAVTAPSQFKK